MVSKIESRERRARKTRAKIKQLGKVRASVHKTAKHIYVQLIAPDGQVLAAVSTTQPGIRAACKSTGNVEAARLVGKTMAEKALAAGVKHMAFDRSGWIYHGRIAALADAMRDGGLEF